MRKNLLLLITVALISAISAYGQSQIIIDENFQDWEATEELVIPDSCEKFSHVAGPFTRKIDYLPGGELTVTLNNYAIIPECDSKKGNGTGVTTGYISLQKEQGDSIGEFIFDPLPNVTSIEFAASSTGQDRGHRLYTSVDGGVTWVGPVGGEHDTSNSQNGNVFVEEINLDNVMLKFTSGVKPIDSNSPQNSRYHNITVYGVPGELPTNITKVKKDNFRIYSVPGTDLFKIEGKFKRIQVYNTLGSIMNSEFTENSNTINLNGAPNGIYIVKAIDASGKEFIQKVVKK